jgi:hypothetical protein
LLRFHSFLWTGYFYNLEKYINLEYYLPSYFFIDVFRNYKFCFFHFCKIKEKSE